MTRDRSRLSPRLRRRALLPILLTPLLPLATPGIARSQGVATGTVGGRDLLGREVTLPRPARRIVLVQGRHLAVLNLLHPDPASLLVGWGQDLRRDQGGEYRAFRDRFPALDALPVLSDDPGVEQVLALQPDLVLLSRRGAAGRGGGANSPLLGGLGSAGVATAVIDFFAQPLRDTEPSLRLLGSLLGRQAQAEALIALHRARLANVSDQLKTLGEPAPTMFMHAHAGGTDCCFSPGRGTLDDFIRLAGGRNIAAETITTVTGQISLESLLTRDPEVYVATGGPYGGRGGVSLGAGVDAALAQGSLRDVVAAQHLEGLRAVRTGRAHAIWHGFNDSPSHVLAVEALARWFHPALRQAIDPAATLAELNGRFAAVPMNGTYWIDLAQAG